MGEFVLLVQVVAFNAVQPILAHFVSLLYLCLSQQTHLPALLRVRTVNILKQCFRVVLPTATSSHVFLVTRPVSLVSQQLRAPCV